MSYKPILSVSEIDDRYVEIAKEVGLPEFNMVESKTLGVFTKERLELKLWRNESIVWKQDGLWANLGEYPKNKHGEIEWTLKFRWVHKYLWGLVTVKGKPVLFEGKYLPMPVYENSKTKNWSVCCMNMRLVSYYELPWDSEHEGFLIVHFPWSMLCTLNAAQYDKELFRKEKYYLNVGFRLQETSYVFVCGPFYREEVLSCAREIHETAIKAKIELIESAIQHDSSEIDERIQKRVTSLRQELQEMREGATDKYNILVSSQTFFPSLNPWVYYRIMQRSGMVMDRTSKS